MAQLRKELREAREEREHLEARRGFLRPGDPVSVYPFIEAEKVEHRNVTKACELMEVSRLIVFSLAEAPAVGVTAYMAPSIGSEWLPNIDSVVCPCRKLSRSCDSQRCPQLGGRARVRPFSSVIPDRCLQWSATARLAD